MILRIIAYTNLKKKDIKAIFAKTGNECAVFGSIKKGKIRQLSVDFESETVHIPLSISICLSDEAIGKLYYFPISLIVLRNGRKIMKKELESIPEINFICS